MTNVTTPATPDADPKPPEPDRFLSEAEECRISGVSRTTRWRMAQRGEYPAKIPISPNRSANTLRRVQAWMAARIAAAQSTDQKSA